MKLGPRSGQRQFQSKGLCLRAYSDLLLALNVQRLKCELMRACERNNGQRIVFAGGV